MVQIANDDPAFCLQRFHYRSEADPCLSRLGVAEQQIHLAAVEQEPAV